MINIEKILYESAKILLQEDDTPKLPTTPPDWATLVRRQGDWYVPDSKGKPTTVKLYDSYIEYYKTFYGITDEAFNLNAAKKAYTDGTLATQWWFAPVTPRKPGGPSGAGISTETATTVFNSDEITTDQPCPDGLVKYQEDGDCMRINVDYTDPKNPVCDIGDYSDKDPADYEVDPSSTLDQKNRPMYCRKKADKISKFLAWITENLWVLPAFLIFNAAARNAARQYATRQSARGKELRKKYPDNADLKIAQQEWQSITRKISKDDSIASKSMQFFKKYFASFPVITVISKRVTSKFGSMKKAATQLEKAEVAKQFETMKAEGLANQEIKNIQNMTKSEYLENAAALEGKTVATLTAEEMEVIDGGWKQWQKLTSNMKTQLATEHIKLAQSGFLSFEQAGFMLGKDIMAMQVKVPGLAEAPTVGEAIMAAEQKAVREGRYEGLATFLNQLQ